MEAKPQFWVYRNPKDWRNWGSTLQPLVYKVSILITTPWRFVNTCVCAKECVVQTVLHCLTLKIHFNGGVWLDYFTPTSLEFPQWKELQSLDFSETASWSISELVTKKIWRQGSYTSLHFWYQCTQAHSFNLNIYSLITITSTTK